MATALECREALTTFSENLGKATGNAKAAAQLDRSLSCWISDLDLTFSGQLRGVRIQDLVEAPGKPPAKAQIRLAMKGDDLVSLVAGQLNFAKAWGSGRLKLEASILDLLKLRSLL
ncbi:SCP2 sterol-binding domain-containing protein [Streptacidiphilus sp. MAP5-3]|uniref:SCP2 sterol-binding domain-containing protein n=1 Tax=unclassified Streptacidiphilus TaxID=2643834 RepID=UPI0035186227